MDQMTNRPDRPLNEDDVRRIVREEISRALRTLGRDAQKQDGYDSDTIESYAYGCITRSAESAAESVLCEHPAYREYVDARRGEITRECSRCGEPEPPAPPNPFEESNAQG